MINKNHNMMMKTVLIKIKQNKITVKPAVKPSVVKTSIKSAFLVGCNYIKSPYQLYGCINDVNNLNSILTSRYKFNKTIILTDNTTTKPTKTNILNNFKNLLINSQVGDTLFFCFSGHGSQTYDFSGDEKDGLDELIVSVDLNYIIDDEFNSLLVTYMKDNVKLFLLFDSCHSASMLDLKYQYIDTSNLNKTTVNSNANNIKGTVVMISGCMDTQMSADAYINNKSQGAMTWSFINSISGNSPIINIVNNMRNLLIKNKYDQIPQLSSNVNIDNMTLFL
jgi:hypothetical protein